MPSTEATSASSSSVSSRASVTRAKPSFCRVSTPARLWTASWVLECSLSDGKCRRTTRATPRSWTMTASAPMSATAPTVSMRPDSSRSATSVLIAT